MNENTMEKSVLTKEKLNIQLNDIRKKCRKRKFHQAIEEKHNPFRR